jgi:hypothetical protein
MPAKTWHHQSNIMIFIVVITCVQGVATATRIQTLKVKTNRSISSSAEGLYLHHASSGQEVKGQEGQSHQAQDKEGMCCQT